MTGAPTRGQLDTLRLEEAAAWGEYLEATRGQQQFRYDEAEPWAWLRLRKRLRSIDARRSLLAARSPR